MKGLWKRAKRFLLMRSEDVGPALRKKLLVFDLAVIVFLLWAIWMRSGCPLPTAEMELRRYERTHLLPRSEIVCSIKAGETVAAGERTVSARGPLTVGVTESGAVVWTKTAGISGGYSVSLEGGPVLRLVPSLDAFPGPWESGVSVLALGVSEEAARGEVELEAGQGGPMAGPGSRLGRGTWLFSAKARGNGYGLSGDAPYVLRLYRADGSLLLEQEGRLGEG